MPHDDSKPERHVSKGDLEKLLKATQVCDRDAGEAKATLAAAYDRAVKKGLNKDAFRFVNKLHRMDAGRAAHVIRALNLYIDMLGLDAQADLEDAMNAAGEDDDDDESIDPMLRVADGIAKETLMNGGKAALERFRVSINGEETADKIHEQRDELIAEYPELENFICEIADERLQSVSTQH